MKMSNQNMNNAVMTYESNGQEINLTMDHVKKYLVRGQADKITNQEVVMFMNLCKYQQLNPFLNEAYLVKFGQDAQIITGKEAFMKRAETNKDYDGFEAGVIVSDKDGNLHRNEGSFISSQQTLEGGWAKVYRKDRSYPVVAEVSMAEYGKKQSTWNSIPGTMIRKVALVQALREAFPKELGAMYTEEEVREPVDVTESAKVDMSQNVEENANSEDLDIPDVEYTEVEPEPEPQSQAESQNEPVQDNQTDLFTSEEPF